MSHGPLDSLLERLVSGDEEAAGNLFLNYEPYLRMVVRRRLSPALRVKFDSADIVQSIWADVLRGFREAGWRFADPMHLRAFLVRITHDRFVDRLRQNQRALAREMPLVADRTEECLVSTDPRPSELVGAAELWQEILTLCPEEHREVLRLKREGVSTADIAARVGLHQGSIRRILGTLSRRLERHLLETRGMASRTVP